MTNYTQSDFFAAIAAVIQGLEPEEILSLCGVPQHELLSFLRKKTIQHKSNLASAREKYAEPSELLPFDILKLTQDEFLTVNQIYEILSSQGMSSLRKYEVIKVVEQLWRGGRLIKRPVRNAAGQVVMAYIARQPEVKK